MLLLWLASVCANAQPAPRAITQRDINVMAASVEDARAALIDNTGLRHPGEDLNVYLRRIAHPLPGETPQVYKTRIQRYLDLLARSANAAQWGQRLPALRDSSPTNRALWERTTRALQLFPARVAHTRTAWQRALTQNHSAPANGVSEKERLTFFDAELAQTVSLLIAIDDGLRDAIP